MKKVSFKDFGKPSQLVSTNPSAGYATSVVIRTKATMGFSSRECSQDA